MNLVGCIAGWVGGHRPCLVGISDLVGAVQTIAVPLEVDCRVVGAVNHEQRESGGHLLNDIDLPVAQDGIGCRVPVATDALALPNGKS